MNVYSGTVCIWCTVWPMFVSLRLNVDVLVLAEVMSLDEDLGQWLSSHYNMRIPELLRSIHRSHPTYSTVHMEGLQKFVELRDRLIGRSRSLRVAAEALIDQQGDEGYAQIMAFIVSNEAFREVLFGIRPVALMDIALEPGQIKVLQELIWGIRQVEGLNINLLRVGGSQYYVYDEYQLKRRSPKEIRRYTVTKEGLEHKIRLDLTRQAGVYYDLTREFREASKVEKRLMGTLSSAILLGNEDKRFCYWDNEEKLFRAGALAGRLFSLSPSKVDVNTTATINREKALVSQLSSELEAETIFNYRIPQVIIDDSTPEIFEANARHLAELSLKYGVEIIHLSSLDRAIHQRGLRMHVAEEYQILIEGGHSAGRDTGGIGEAGCA